MITMLGVTEALRIISKRANKSLAQLCREMDMGTPANLVNMVKRGSMRLSVGATFARHCGYKLMLIPENVDVTEGIEIDGGTEDYL